MKVVIYDRNPGPGIAQWFLSLSWAVGSWLQLLFGPVDACYGASSWEDAVNWLKTQPGPILSIQYWGHGSPGTIWLAGKSLPPNAFLPLASNLTPGSVLWLRTCSSFQGTHGITFSATLADSLNCVVAGHTREIGLFQGGLHTRKPRTPASWPSTEVELLQTSWLERVWPLWLRWGPNTILCFTTAIPDGW